MADILIVAKVALLGLILLSLWVVLYQLVKQQGRMLLRLDDAEHRLAHGSPGIKPSLTLNGAQARPRGLPVGTLLATFQLSDLTGQMVSLDDFRGKRLLLVNWNKLSARARLGYRDADKEVVDCLIDDSFWKLFTL